MGQKVTPSFDNIEMFTSILVHMIHEAKSQVGLDETGQEVPNFPKIATDISGVKIHFGM